MKYIDLHVHSTASDGTLSPSEVVDAALKAGLSAFALTDHDTTNGVSEALSYAESLAKKGKKIEVIPGTEISAGYKNRDIHILGLFIDYTSEPLNTALAGALKRRDERNLKMLDRFKSLGIDISMDELKAGSEDTVITRAHFARVLISRKIVSSNEEAFQKYLNQDCPCYVPREYLSPEEVIKLILDADGIPVLAHPLLYKLPESELLELISRLKKSGLAGLEVFYSNNQGLDEGLLRRYAITNDLIMTGGSDFHGANKPLIAIGSGRGNLKIPYSVLDKLKAYKNGR